MSRSSASFWSFSLLRSLAVILARTSSSSRAFRSAMYRDSDKVAKLLLMVCSCGGEEQEQRKNESRVKNESRRGKLLEAIQTKNSTPQCTQDKRRRPVSILLVYALNLVQRPIAPISIYSPASLGRPLLSACPAGSYSPPRFSSWKYREESSTLAGRQPGWLKAKKNNSC